jgi:hypothetical protein
MRAVGNHRGARTISIALAAGLVAFEAVLALGAGAFGIPGLLLVRFTAGSMTAQPARGSGETVVAKIAEIETAKIAKTPSALLAEKPPEPPRIVDARDLKGLTEVPQDTEWDREKSKRTDESAPKAFDHYASGQERLPWDQVEPVPLSSLASASPTLPGVAAEPAIPARAPVELPGELGAWVKAKATEFKGADRSRPLYHFELWLEPPAEVKRRLVAVLYDFSTPAVQPQTQASSDEATGFRVSAGGLACADTITVTLKFDDGRTQQFAVDGCKLFG